MTNYDEQARTFLNNASAKMKISFADYERNKNWNDKYFRNKYRVTPTTKKGSMWFYFWDSAYNTQNEIEPSEYDILACLEKHDAGEYRDFCNDFGYEFNADSKHIYNACKKQYNSLCRIFTSEQMEELREIQ